MSSNYSTDLKLELMTTGENAGTWGDKTNTNLNLVQQAIAGFEQITLSSGGTVALAMTDGALSTARNMVIKFATITAGSSTVCTVPDSIEKFYIFDCRLVTNPTNLTIKTASGTGFSPDAQKIYAAYSDGTNITEVSLDTLGGTIGTAQIADDAVDNDKIADNAVRAAQLSNNAVITAKIIDNAVLTAKISNKNVTTAKIADDAVGADQLANTTVSAGTYALATITVDAQGRITSAAAGSAGGGGFVPNLEQSGGQTGTFTAQTNSSAFLAYMGAGGGGTNPQRQGAANGGFGIWSATFSQPFTANYSVGTGGGLNQSGNATNFHNFTANGGGMVGGSPGNAPGASWPGPATNFPQPSRSGSGIYWARGTGGGVTSMTSGVNGGPGNLWVWEA